MSVAFVSVLTVLVEIIEDMLISNSILPALAFSLDM